MTPPRIGLTLGPVLFNWPVERWRDFHFRIADEAEIDCVHLGEVVCAKRQPFTLPLMAEVAERLRAAGKQVVFSTLALVTSQDERASLEGWDEGQLVEANDMSAVAALSGRPFVAGPLLNLYNEGSLDLLARLGAVRACLPAELPASSIAILAAGRRLSIEVQAFGRLPLAISARCYHARAHGLHKDGCRYVCAEDPDGMEVDTLDGRPFLAVNGTQTMSFQHLCLLGELDGLRRAGVEYLRLWPASGDMVAVAALYRAVLDGRTDPDEALAGLKGLMPGAGFANGFLHGQPGADWVDAGR